MLIFTHCKIRKQHHFTVSAFNSNLNISTHVSTVKTNLCLIEQWPMKAQDSFTYRRKTLTINPDALTQHIYHRECLMFSAVEPRCTYKCL